MHGAFSGMGWCVLDVMELASGWRDASGMPDGGGEWRQRAWGHDGDAERLAMRERQGERHGVRADMVADVERWRTSGCRLGWRGQVGLGTVWTRGQPLPGCGGIRMRGTCGIRHGDVVGCLCRATSDPGRRLGTRVCACPASRMSAYALRAARRPASGAASSRRRGIFCEPRVGVHAFKASSLIVRPSSARHPARSGGAPAPRWRSPSWTRRFVTLASEALGRFTAVVEAVARKNGSRRRRTSCRRWALSTTIL
jgi:hypothetical protein